MATIIKDDRSEVFLLGHWSYYKASGDIENDGVHN